MSQSDKLDKAVTIDIVLFSHFEVLELYCNIWLFDKVNIETSVNDDLLH